MLSVSFNALIPLNSLVEWTVRYTPPVSNTMSVSETFIERINVYGYLLWVAVLAIVLLRAEKGPTEKH